MGKGATALFSQREAGRRERYTQRVRDIQRERERERERETDGETK